MRTNAASERYRPADPRRRPSAPPRHPLVAAPAPEPRDAGPGAEVAADRATGGSAFDRIGGPAGVREAIDRWLLLVTADLDLAPYLVGVDLRRLAGNLALLLTAALGGPPGDIVRPTEEVWRGLGLVETDHRRMVDYLTGVLWAMNMPANGIVATGRALRHAPDRRRPQHRGPEHRRWRE